MNAASVQLFGAALDASDFARVMDKPEVVPGQKSCSRRSLRSPFQDSFRLADKPPRIVGFFSDVLRDYNYAHAWPPPLARH